MATSSEDRYTDPQLRDRIKAEVTAGDRGGKPGQWSARKAQLVASEYKKAGGGYTTDKEHESSGAAHLDEWTDEDWQTSDGSPDAGHGRRRYLPKEAWEQLSDEEKAQTDRVKAEGDAHGEQFVANSPAAAQAGKRVRERSHDEHSGNGGSGASGGSEPLPGYDGMTAEEVLGHLGGLDDAGRDRVRAYEQEHAGRKTVLRRLG